MQDDQHSTPKTLAKAKTPVERLRWLLWRVSQSRLDGGVSRESIQKVYEHYWACEGKQRCLDDRQRRLAEEGQRAATDHTYHVVSNLAAPGSDGRSVALKASLSSAMGQKYVLGCKVWNPLQHYQTRFGEIIM